MSIPNINVSSVIQWAASQYLEMKELPPDRKRDLQRLTEYNILAHSFNASTVLLAVAAVAAVFFSTTAAAAFGMTALLVRSIASNEIENLAKPRGIQRLTQAINQTELLTPGVRAGNICESVGVYLPCYRTKESKPVFWPEESKSVFWPEESKSVFWAEESKLVFGYITWKRTLPQNARIISAEDETGDFPYARRVTEFSEDFRNGSGENGLLSEENGPLKV